MLKLPKGLKKKKKGKKSKRKGEDELFTEEELEKYRKEQQQKQAESGETTAKENEEWSKFKDLTTGVDSVLKKTQGDLDRIKSTSFFQRIPTGAKKPENRVREELQRPVVEVTEADFPQLVAAAAATAAESESGDKSDYGITDDESEEEDDQDDIFDTSYVDAVERGEVKLAYVPDSPEDFKDDDIFDTSHVDALIKGQDAKTSKGKKGLDIGVAVEVLTGRIDNLTITTKKSKRVIPGDLLLENEDRESVTVASVIEPEPTEKSILDLDTDIPITIPIDLSVSLHTTLIQQQKNETLEDLDIALEENIQTQEEQAEDDEFTLLAAESLEVKPEVIKLEDKEIILEPVLEESWSAFEADKNESVFAEGIVEDQLDVIDPYIDQDDPFDTSFADAVVPSKNTEQIKQEAVILEDDEDFDPRAEEYREKFNNRRKSSVRIHLTNPAGIRESITSDDINDSEENKQSRDLLGGSVTDLTQLGDSPLDPLDIQSNDIDPFDTTIVDKIVAPGKVELKLLEQELIGDTKTTPIYRVPSDPDFDPRADEPKNLERRASRPENLTVNKSVVFDINSEQSSVCDTKSKPSKPLTPYYIREVSISEDTNEQVETSDKILNNLTRTRSQEDITITQEHQTKRRHSEFPQPGLKNTFIAANIFHESSTDIQVKVLTPIAPLNEQSSELDEDPFDTSFASNIEPSRIELKLLAKEFSTEESSDKLKEANTDLLEPEADDFFQVKALSPQPLHSSNIPEEDFDPFDTSFAGDLNPGKTELKLLESELLN